MPRKIVAFVLLALVLAALFVRLGFWQLSRLRERKAFNAELVSRMKQAPVPLVSLGAGDRMRRAYVEGAPDYEHEFVQAGRSMNGSPGVYVFTPVRLDSARAVLVNRGWVYAPDAATVNLSQWRETRSRFSGYTMPFADQKARTAPRARSTHVVNAAAVAELVPYPVAPLYLVARDSGGPATPARLPDIELTNGPHLSYAIQWFSFAAIAVIGAGFVVTRARRTPRDGSTAA